MSVAVTALMLFAALLGAVAHALIRAGRDRLTTRTLVSAVAGLCYLPALLFANPLTADTIFWLAISLPVHVAYHFLLIGAYRYGDFAQVYPIARGTGPLLVALFAMPIAGEQLSWPVFAGVVMISAGAIWSSGGRLRSRQNGLAVLLAAATGLSLAIFSTADGMGVRGAIDPFDFIAWYFVLDGVVMSLFFLLLRRGRWAECVAQNWRGGSAGGLLAAILFGITIWAMSQGPLAVVVALRETSIIFAALIGVFVFKESMAHRRLSAAALISLGVIVMHL